MRKQHIMLLMVGLLALLFVDAGCAQPEIENSAEKATTAKTPASKTEVLPKLTLSASHILVMHNESQRKPSNVNRTKKAALARINEALAKIKGGADFAEVAKEYSDCSSKTKGGDLGNFPSRMMVAPFAKATIDLKVGQISDPVETKFGYHVIKRQKVDLIRARHILVMHNRSMNKRPTITRTKEEALKRIKEVQKKLHAKDSDFAALAKEYSDCASKDQGGDLGAFGKGRMSLPFDNAVFALKVDETSDIVETPFGYHIIQRLPDPEQK